MNSKEVHNQLETAKQHINDGAAVITKAEIKRHAIDGRIGQGLENLRSLQTGLASLQPDVTALCQYPDEALRHYKAGSDTIHQTGDQSTNPLLTTAGDIADGIVRTLDASTGSPTRANLERMHRGSQMVEQALGMLAAGLEELEEGSFAAFTDFARIAGFPDYEGDHSLGASAAISASQRVNNAVTTYQQEYLGTTP